MSSEIAGETEDINGHVTAGAWIVNPDAEILLVFGRKEGAWRSPGAHCEDDLVQTAKSEAARALGRATAAQNSHLWALAEREIAQYWQTPAHRHFELIFRFNEPKTSDLPRGARWFTPAEVAALGDATLLRLLQKCP